jgi:DNA primase
MVVESPMSVAKAVSLGLHNVVSTFGAKVSREQIRLLREGGFETIYIWFDRDSAGVKGERKLAEGLYRVQPVKVVTPHRGKDLADCDLADIAVYLKHAVPAALKLGYSDMFRRAR